VVSDCLVQGSVEVIRSAAAAADTLHDHVDVLLGSPAMRAGCAGQLTLFSHVNSGDVDHKARRWPNRFACAFKEAHDAD